MTLTDLPTYAQAIVDHVDDFHSPDIISQRLRDLGFVPGEPVRVVARAPWGGDPLLIHIGSTRFALRQAEARRVVINWETAHD